MIRAAQSPTAGDAIAMMQRVRLRRAIFAGEKTARNAPLSSVAALAAALSDGAPTSAFAPIMPVSFAAIKQATNRLKAVLGRKNLGLVKAVLGMAIAVAVRPNDRLVVAKLAQVFLGQAAVDDDSRVAVAL